MAIKINSSNRKQITNNAKSQENIPIISFTETENEIKCPAMMRYVFSCVYDIFDNVIVKHYEGYELIDKVNTFIVRETLPNIFLRLLMKLDPESNLFFKDDEYIKDLCRQYSLINMLLKGSKIEYTINEISGPDYSIDMKIMMPLSLLKNKINNFTSSTLNTIIKYIKSIQENIVNNLYAEYITIPGTNFINPMRVMNLEFDNDSMDTIISDIIVEQNFINIIKDKR